MKTIKTLSDFKSLEQNCEDMSIIRPTEPEERMELREAIINYKRSWAQEKLHNKFGWNCLVKGCKYCDQPTSEMIAGEGGDNNE